MSLRARVTLALAAMLAIVLVATAAYVRARVADDLQDAQDRSLRARSAQLAAAVERGALGPGLPDAPGVETDEDVAQVLAADGTVVAGTREALEPLLPAGRRRPGFHDRPGDERLDEDLRLLATAARTRDGRPVLAVVGASADEVDEARSALTTAQAAGLAAALLVGGLGAWWLAGAVVRPVRAALERERRFVADAAHELRTPLAVLRSELEVTRMEDSGEEGLRAALSSAQEETERLSRLADDLLLLARADEDGVPLHPREVELGPLLARAARGRPGVTVEPTDLRVRADDLRLEQAVRNLVDNALRHGAAPVDVAARRAGATVTISVRDHGSGLPDGFADRAFERFARGGAARGDGDGGAGLGLSIVAAIARAHGGEARLRAADPGTVAELVLPHRPLIDGRAS
jgi:signal transduction histidine kinase